MFQMFTIQAFLLTTLTISALGANLKGTQEQAVSWRAPIFAPRCTSAQLDRNGRGWVNKRIVGDKWGARYCSSGYSKKWCKTDQSFAEKCPVTCRKCMPQCSNTFTYDRKENNIGGKRRYEKRTTLGYANKYGFLQRGGKTFSSSTTDQTSCAKVKKKHGLKFCNRWYTWSTQNCPRMCGKCY